MHGSHTYADVSAMALTDTASRADPVACQPLAQPRRRGTLRNMIELYDRERLLSEMRSLVTEARQAARFNSERDRFEMLQLADELDKRADELEAKWKPANSNDPLPLRPRRL